MSSRRLEEHDRDRRHVSPGRLPLFNTQMSVDGRVPSGTSQILVFSIGNVLPSSIVAILLRQTKVNEEHLRNRRVICARST